MDLIRSAFQHLHTPAVVAEGATTRYLDLLRRSIQICETLGLSAPRISNEEPSAVAGSPGPRVALMCEPGAGYVASTWGTWLHRGIAVPLCLSHPDRSLQYVLEDAGVTSVLASERHAERMHKLSQPFGASIHIVDSLPGANQQGEARTSCTSGTSSSSSSPSTAGGASDSSSKSSSSSRGSSSTWLEEELSAVELEWLQTAVETCLGRVHAADGALIIYTSGTTGNPKGALHTHRSVMAQVRTLCEAWRWQPSDRILHSLPLHHIHGVVNALYCALYAGATVEFMPKFSPEDTWQRLMRRDDPLSLFMGVPTMYAFLLSKFDEMSQQQQSRARQAAGALRLAVSGSSACPLPIMSRWEELSGQRLLERYGMSETGMILGNPYDGERRPGTVGLAFPGVEVKLVGKPGDRPGVGEVHVKSEQLFSHYWGKPEATKEAFDSEGYFITGDIAELSGLPPYYSLLGRSSVDIIKHGGFKLSALQIESVLLEHPSLKECAVVGVPDPTYGEAVCLLAVTKPGRPPLELDSLRTWAQDKLSKPQTPTRLLLMDALPRNAMGKINKKELRKLVPEE